MSRLGVQHPDIVTRVSEYIPEILSFIETLENNGYAYCSNGSVYFDTLAYSKNNHVLGKLVPEQIGNSDLLAEGEGSLSSFSNEKRSPSDFALWKKTKVHDDGIVEPFWESKWGNGRPGWHIECSAMCHSAFEGLSDNGCIDIHAGGVDLKFPHHENEIAQSEGHCECHQWVNFWLHTGHLNIDGLKMSKSLKNFISIRGALTVYSARQLRFAFLLHKYNAPMDYSDNIMSHAVVMEKTFSEYFHNVKAVFRRYGLTGNQYVGAKEKALLQALELMKDQVHHALEDDFDTPSAIIAMSELVKASNRYQEECAKAVNTSILLSVSRAIYGFLKIFGVYQDPLELNVVADPSSSLISSSSSSSSSASSSSSSSSSASSSEGSTISQEQILSPYLDALAQYREKVRVFAMAGNMQAILDLTDALRDDVMPELGVRMEDKGVGGEVFTVWKLDDPETLKKEKALKKEARAAKEQQKLEAERKQREKEEKARIPPQQLFRSFVDLYSVFDEEGIPTHNAAGEPLPKSARKKLVKEMDQHKALHEKYAAKL